MEADALIEIPSFISEVYRRYRPSPLVRARSLEKYLGTTSEIYYKREDLNPAGSHKFNTALVQAYYATLEEESNIRSMVTDTGAGQWGAALAMACETLGLGCDVFMIRKSFEEKPYRRYLMRMAGANVFSSPSELTQTGRNILRDDPNNSGSLGIGMSEANRVRKGRSQSTTSPGLYVLLCRPSSIHHRIRDKTTTRTS